MVKSTIFVKSPAPVKSTTTVPAGAGWEPLPWSHAMEHGAAEGYGKVHQNFRPYDGALLHEIMTIKYSDYPLVN